MIQRTKHLKRNFNQTVCKPQKEKKSEILTQVTTKMFNKFNSLFYFFPELNMSIMTGSNNKVCPAYIKLQNKFLKQIYESLSTPKAITHSRIFVSVIIGLKKKSPLYEDHCIRIDRTLQIFKLFSEYFNRCCYTHFNTKS